MGRKTRPLNGVNLPAVGINADSLRRPRRWAQVRSVLMSVGGSDMDANAPAMARISVIVALAAIGYFLIASVATHIVSTQYDLVRDYISDYAVGPYGWIYGSAFFASCVGCIALSIALWMTVPHAALSRSGVVMLAIVGISYAIDFYFPTDILQPGQPPQTRIGAIHLADAFLGWVIYVIAAFLISSRLRRDAY